MSNKNNSKRATESVKKNSGSRNSSYAAGNKKRRKKNSVSGVVIGALIVLFVVFNIFIIILDAKDSDKDDKSEAKSITLEDPSTQTTELVKNTTEASSETEATTEEPTTEKPRDMLVSIRKEFPELTVEDQEKVLYIHQNMYKYTSDLVMMLHKNHEALQFIYEYPDARLRPVNNDISEELKEVKNGKIPLFLQWDQRWGYMEYGDGLMAYNGCGPTCLSMVVTYLTGSNKYSPAVIAEYAMEHNYYYDGAGTAWSLIHTGCEEFGVRSYEVGLSESAMADAVQANNPIIACVGEGDFTDGGHFIVLTGYKDGKFSVNDPNSPKRSEQLWDFDRLETQIDGLWAFYRDESLTTEDITAEDFGAEDSTMKAHATEDNSEEEDSGDTDDFSEE